MGNIVVCLDGTWNTPEQLAGGVPAPTNVYKIYGALAEADGQGTPQQRYYHSGVGASDKPWERITGGAVGKGLGEIIVDAYAWLSRTYRPGDRIFLFGFSRGAYAVRSLAGWIGGYGLLDGRAEAPEVIWNRVGFLYKNGYRRGEPPEDAKAWAFHNARAGHSAAGTTPIHFLGVWDTVGALGIPDDRAFLNLLDRPSAHGFHDTGLSAAVLNARHAVAIDEQRLAFTPTFWTEIPAKSDVQQVWFPGGHGDVGGGHRECGLSDIALDWMMTEAMAKGLAIRPGARAQVAGDPRGAMHDAVTGFWKVMNTRPRSVPSFGDRRAPFHPAALDRHGNPALSDGAYWETQDLRSPRSVTVRAGDPWNRTGLYLEKGVTYSFAAEGQWQDAAMACGPDGLGIPGGPPLALGHVFGTGLGAVEKWVRKLPTMEHARFLFTRRHEDMPWFSLVGTLANGKGMTGAFRVAEHESFMIGKGTTYTPKASGYLYCYANDSLQMYGNNTRWVTLTVARGKGAATVEQDRAATTPAPTAAPAPAPAPAKPAPVKAAPPPAPPVKPQAAKPRAAKPDERAPAPTDTAIAVVEGVKALSAKGRTLVDGLAERVKKAGGA